MSQLTSLALMFGGKSPEHDVSIRSARNIFQAIDRARFSVTLIGVDRSGIWKHISEAEFLAETLELDKVGNPLAVIPGREHDQIISLDDQKEFPQIDVVFSIIHGIFGEDGTLQGLLRQINLPFVGPDVLGSAVAMDKDVAKRLLKEADLLVAEGLVFHRHEADAIDFVGVRNQLGMPVFIKPANMGSSVGVSRAENLDEFTQAVNLAFKYDRKILIESAIEGREVECAVMGNEVPETTTIGEVTMNIEGFYDYDSKYESDVAAQVTIPAEGIAEDLQAKLILVAKSAYKVLECEGMARVDMFLTEEGRVFINEVNTLPGFTNISMYPKLWEHAGTSYSDLITHLVELGIERSQSAQSLEKNK
ncbi:D-alanine--D-alanine ligase [Pontibacter sp. G13]|uniref:D-alanine--D-alanine ligase n=1 Tax=Pontibacter sp. G13 TaxID=3074898 RepID=UPI00288B8208|nr:D-alanine--D-alanine ligase [Pontibacter sp. G13]WNJ21494.1 D-alanine--D-alanine ligase [Pontibacter sp. G13]